MAPASQQAKSQKNGKPASEITKKRQASKRNQRKSGNPANDSTIKPTTLQANSSMGEQAIKGGTGSGKQREMSNASTANAVEATRVGARQKPPDARAILDLVSSRLNLEIKVEILKS